MADREHAMPLVAIVLPAYNAADTLGRAIDSVLAQTVPAWELIVVNDGSTDGTGTIASMYQERDSRVRLMEQDNKGVAAARNAAIASTTSEIVTFLDADDELAPAYLELMLAFAEDNPGYQIYHPEVEIRISDDGSQRFSGDDQVMVRGFEELLHGCAIALGGAVVRRELFAKVGGFRPDILCEDYDFWLRATSQGAKALYLPQALYTYHQESGSRRSQDSLRGIDDAIRSLEDLITTKAVGPETTGAVEAAIVRKREERAEAAHEQLLAAQAQFVTARVEGILGPRAARPVVGALRWLGRVARPVRQAMVGPVIASAAAGPRLKVLVIASWYPGPANSTAGIFIKQQVDALASLCDVAVLHVGYGESRLAAYVTQDDGVPVARAEVRPSALGQLVDVRSAGIEAFDLLREQWGTPDIIHVQALWPAATIARALSRHHNIPYVVTEHSEEYLPHSERRLAKYPLVVGALLRPLARDASRIIAVSRFLADRLVELGLAQNPLVIPNVVPAFEPAPIAQETPHVIAHVSVMGAAKDLPGLLEAVRQLREQRDDFILKLVGDGERREEAKRVADTLDLTGFVEFTGRKSQDEVAGILAGSAFVVVSSTHETFSVSAAESLMAGRPVVSTRCGGPEEFITPEVGRLVDVGDPTALAEGLDWMLDHYAEFDPQALHAYAATRFAPDVVAQRIIEVYEEVVGG